MTGNAIRRILFAHFLATAAAGAGVTASAQGQDDNTGANLDEVLVTSTKVGESRLAEVPASITAIGEAQINTAGMESFTDYARHVPGLGYQVLSAAGDRDDIRGGRRVNLRGIESGYDGVPTVAYYIDDAPIPVMDPNMFDVERIEVLRGPQGTLYGANSMGGTIRVLMNKPDLDEYDFGGEATLSAMPDGEGSYDLSGMANVPLAEDRVALRAVAYYRSLGGFIDNVERDNPAGTQIVDEDVNSGTIWGTRLSLRFQPTDDLAITPSVYHQDTAIEWGAEYQPDFGDLQVFNKRVPTPENNEFTLSSLEVIWTRGDWELFSSTAYFDSDFDSVEDATDFYYQFGIVTPDQIARNLQEISTERFSEELRLSYSSERFRGVLGAFYLDEERFFWQDFPRSYGDPSRPDFFYGTQLNEEEQLAFFGDGTYDFTDRLSASLGVRWFEGEASQNTRFYSGGVLDPRPIIESSDSDVSPRLSINYKPNGEGLVYASATAGFRPGGPNAAIPLSAPGCPEALAELGMDSAPSEYLPDELWSYEVGTKLTSERGAVNLAAYLIDWSDVQQTVFLGAFATGECGFTFIGNVGKAESQGVEAEFSYDVTSRFTLGGSAAYTDSQFTRSNPSIGIEEGDRLPLVPEWTASASANYGFTMLDNRDGYFYLDVAYRDKMLDGLSATVLDALTTVNTRLGAHVNDKVELVIFVNNLLDERGGLNIFNIPPGGPLDENLLNHVITNQPRTFGFTVRYDF